MRFVDDLEVSPSVWQVCFVGGPRKWPWEWLLAPRYLHVFLLGYLPEYRLWLRYEILLGHTEITLMSGPLAGRHLTRAMDEGGVLSWPALPVHPGIRPRLGFYCVTAVCHALGLRCVAATPRGLHDWLLRNGAKPLSESQDEPLQR